MTIKTRCLKSETFIYDYDIYITMSAFRKSTHITLKVNQHIFMHLKL